jgi:hypothetical protein
MEQRYIEEHLIIVRRILSDLESLEITLSGRDLKYLLERIESAFMFSNLPDNDEYFAPRWKLISGISKFHLSESSFDKHLTSTYKKAKSLVRDYLNEINANNA